MVDQLSTGVNGQEPSLGGSEDSTTLTGDEAALGAGRDLAHIAEAMRADDLETRTRAAMELGMRTVSTRRGSPDPHADEALALLLAALKDDHPATRLAAARVCGALAIQRAADPLIASLGDPDDRAFVAIANALGKIGEERAVRPLMTVYATALHREEVANERAKDYRTPGGAVLDALTRIGTPEAKTFVDSQRILRQRGRSARRQTPDAP